MDAPLPRLSGPQRAGQRVVFSYPGLEPPDALLDQIATGRVGGVIFFAENVGAPDAFAAAVADLVAAQAGGPVAAPLLLLTDQEGGAVRRLPGPPHESAKDVGTAPDPLASAAATGSAAGLGLAEFGLNANLAPVLDVTRVPGDFSDRWGRSYGADAELVAGCGAAFVRAQQRVGVAATAKHFPGLGPAPTTANTDLEPVLVDDLDDRDERPFRAAIAAGVELVMPSWALYPELDPDRPAGLSPTVVRGRLRERLGFAGVTISDALEAGGLAAYGSDAARARAAVGAGMDLVLCSARDVAQGESVRAALAELPTEDPHALARIFDLRRRVGPR